MSLPRRRPPPVVFSDLAVFTLWADRAKIASPAEHVFPHGRRTVENKSRIAFDSAAMIRGTVFSPKQIVTIAVTWLALVAHQARWRTVRATLGREGSGNGCRVRLIVTSFASRQTSTRYPQRRIRTCWCRFEEARGGEGPFGVQMICFEHRRTHRQQGYR